MIMVQPMALISPAQINSLLSATGKFREVFSIISKSQIQFIIFLTEIREKAGSFVCIKERRCEPGVSFLYVL